MIMLLLQSLLRLQRRGYRVGVDLKMRGYRVGVGRAKGRIRMSC